MGSFLRPSVIVSSPTSNPPYYRNVRKANVARVAGREEPPGDALSEGLFSELEPDGRRLRGCTLAAEHSNRD